MLLLVITTMLLTSVGIGWVASRLANNEQN
jgi:hypothetical protein